MDLEQMEEQETPSIYLTACTLAMTMHPRQRRYQVKLIPHWLQSFLTWVAHITTD